MIFLSALVLSGAIVYLVDSDRGALLIAAGCALALVKWLAGLPAWQSKPTARPDVSTETQEAAQAGTDHPA
jgi:hypothetical protein